MASIPFAMVDAVIFGSMVYFFVGLAINDGASVANYFVFVALMFTISFTSGLFFSVFSSCVQDVTTAQAAMAVVAVVFVLFSGECHCCYRIILSHKMHVVEKSCLEQRLRPGLLIFFGGFFRLHCSA